MAALKTLKIDLSYDPTMLLLGIYVKECKWAYNRDNCTAIVIATLLTIIKLWNQSINWWMDKENVTSDSCL
jgi:hypothetical protein